MNQLLLLSGVGMIAVGTIPVVYWKMKKKLGMRFFLAGAFIWFVAMILKLLIDFTISPGINSWLAESTGTIGVILFAGAIMGIRTGLLENGLSYLGILKYKPLGKMNYEEGIAFGLGFGCIEAFVFGVLGFFNLLVLVISPELILNASVAVNAPTIIAIAPIIERLFTLIIHVMCSLLVIYSIKTNSIKYFIYAFFFKTLLDSAVFVMSAGINYSDISTIFAVELPIIALGGVSLWVIDALKKKFENPKEESDENTNYKVVITVIAVIVVIAVSIITYSMIPATVQKKSISTPEFRVPNLAFTGGKYIFRLSGRIIGYSKYDIGNITLIDGKMVYQIKEKADITASGHHQNITGEFHVDSNGFPVYYYSVLEVDGRKNTIEVNFGKEYIFEKVTQVNVPSKIRTQKLNNTFMIGNNMIGHFVVLYRSIKTVPNTTYSLNIYSSNFAKNMAITITDTGKTQEFYTKDGFGNDVSIETEIYEDSLGQTLYVTSKGDILKIMQGNLEISLDRFYMKKEGIS